MVFKSPDENKFENTYKDQQVVSNGFEFGGK